MLQRFREPLALILITLLPLHALFVTVGTKMIAGPGQSPIARLALWKEALLGVILILAIVEIFQNAWKQSEDKSRQLVPILRIDILDALIVALLLIALALGLFTGSIMSPDFLFGFKYDFVPLGAFIILRRVDWSERFLPLVLKHLLGVGVFVALIGVFFLFLPHSFFVWLGYGDLHSLYIPSNALAPYQQIGGTALRRMQSTFSGPNQLGLWLLLPWSITLLAFCTSGSLLDRFIQKFRFSVGCKRYLHDALLVIIGLALFFTFSRSAWIAAAVVILLMLHRTLTMQEFRKSLVRIGGVCIAVFLLSALLAPQVILRATSSNDHLLRPIQAAHIMRGNPLGLGLGSAGPASNRVSDTCIFLEDGSDVLWTLNHPSLCVFVGGTQVQPKAHCSCPLLTENWYLQIGVELGILGFILYIFLTILLLKKLATSETGPRYAVFLIFAGVSTASLFLHAWEGSAVAYTVWLLVAVNLKVSLRRFFFGRFSS